MGISAVEQKAIDYVIGKAGGAGNEGGYSNNPNDKGGPTFSGFTLKTVRALSAQIHGHDFDKDKDGDIDSDDLKKLTYDDLVALADTYWDADLDYLLSSVIAIKTYDFCFNCGVKSGVKLLQKAVNYVLGPKTVVEDGVLGPKTVGLANTCDGNLLLKGLIEVAKEHYRLIVMYDPTQSEFLSGWLHRAERVPNGD